MPLTEAQADDFGKYARNPETWMLAARRNLAVSLFLRQRFDDLASSTDRDFFEFSGCYYAEYFHAALAIENALKAVLISRDPSIITKTGTLNIKKFKGRSGHALLDPALLILGSLTDAERRFISKLEEYIWAGRYTVPMKADVLFDHARMNNLRTSTVDEPDMLRSLMDRLASFVKALDK